MVYLNDILMTVSILYLIYYVTCSREWENWLLGVKDTNLF